LAFGIYVHWPFCAAKCPYCDFNSHVRSAIDEEGWVAAIGRELEWTAKAQGEDRPIVETIFFGGGTPSLMSGKSTARILDKIARGWRMANDVEITLEANPASADAARFADYRAAGVNRLSLGVQALNDTDLKALGRLHNAEEGKAALALAMRNFGRVSLDLIYARPNQGDAAWRTELKQALAFGTGHLSLYQLTIEPETPFALLHKNGALVIPDEDVAAELYETTQELTEAAGLPAYEISNHARPGSESRHNLIYWRYGEYVGVGPGAHGRVGPFGERRAQATERHPEMWLAQVESEGHGLIENAPLSREEQGDELLLNSLRLREGLDLPRFEALSGRALRRRQIDELASLGFISEDSNGRLRVTHAGFPLLDTIVADLAA